MNIVVKCGSCLHHTRSSTLKDGERSYISHTLVITLTPHSGPDHTLFNLVTQKKAVAIKQRKVTQVYQLPIWLLPCGRGGGHRAVSVKVNDVGQYGRYGGKCVSGMNISVGAVR